MKKYFPYIFILIVILQLTGVYFDSALKFISKPLIMISLASYYFAYARNFKMIFFTAIVAALMGDIFLMWEHEMSFILGLGSFLIMQVLYTIVFFNQKDHIDKIDFLGTIIIAIMTVVLMYILIPDVEGVLKYAVSVYCLCIMAMVISAIWRDKSHPSYLPVLCGGLLFLISDAVLAIDRFSLPLEFGSLLVIGTYMAAQYLIVVGISDGD